MGLLPTALVIVSVLLLWQRQLHGMCTKCFSSLHIIFYCPSCRVTILRDRVNKYHMKYLNHKRPLVSLQEGSLQIIAR